MRDADGKVIGLVSYPGGMPGVFASNVENLLLQEVKISRPNPLPEGFHPEPVVILQNQTSVCPDADRGGAAMKTIRKLDKLLSVLAEQIFQPIGVRVPLVYRQAAAEERASMVASDRSDWVPVGPDHIWGEPDGYYWFGGKVVLPEGLDGSRLFGRIEAAFGNVMGRSDPQCLVRVDGRIVQGGDANHREFPLNLNAVAGQSHDILIEAGTIEDRRQIGFGSLCIATMLMSKTFTTICACRSMWRVCSTKTIRDDTLSSAWSSRRSTRSIFGQAT